ncbi:hypothetical protein [Pseudomonas citronellolis]|uniref:hypothetical protein n=1 Tax=Pseudomonas citronellolis TaxID=53408 RepID=UPI0023E3F9D1|nr:hypothetical protein [Pseudomonas citronellolis]MDF3933412.1 hypothetical protein [Pseudomonas citronellolis]
MKKWVFDASALDRRGFLRACVVLGMGGAVARLPGAGTRRLADDGGFVVVNGWVLPARYFQDAQG